MSLTHFTALTAAILASTVIAPAIAERNVRDLKVLWEDNQLEVIRDIESRLPVEVRQDIAARRSDGLIEFPAKRTPTIERPRLTVLTKAA